jgi:hypothetical protein
MSGTAPPQKGIARELDGEPSGEPAVIAPRAPSPQGMPRAIDAAHRPTRSEETERP